MNFDTVSFLWDYVDGLLEPAYISEVLTVGQGIVFGEHAECETECTGFVNNVIDTVGHSSALGAAFFMALTESYLQIWVALKFNYNYIKGYS